MYGNTGGKLRLDVTGDLSQCSMLCDAGGEGVRDSLVFIQRFVC